MNEFMTKEYIELAKDKRRQGLRPKIQMYDYISPVENPNPERAIADWTDDLDFFINRERDNYIFLPDSDFLDAEIARLCKGDWTYYFIYDIADNAYYAEIKESYRHVYSFNSDNPLIAKILLLIKLLEGE